MLTPTATTIRLFLHVLAAAVWVGGQVTLAGLVPALRKEGGHPVTKAAAQAFARVAWPAYLIVVVTGIWNLFEVDFADARQSYQYTVMVKVLVVVLAGMFTAIHQVGRTKVALAVGGSLAALCSLAALFLGVLLRSGR